MRADVAAEDVSSAIRRTGPVSRIYRLVLVALLMWGAISIFLDGRPGFATSTIREPGFWVLAIVLPHLIFEIPRRVAGARWGRRVAIAFGVLIIATATVAVTRDGVLWTAPLTTVVYGAVLAAALLTAAALVLSVFLGTPGCDVGALEEAVRRLRGTFDPNDAPVYWCIVGLHWIDAWESRQR